jgi:metal-sulfur cluster biosynthetic enzyme
MTFTSQGCPLGPAIEAGVRRVVDELEWVKATNIRIVWSPPWNPGMIERDQA